MLGVLKQKELPETKTDKPVSGPPVLPHGKAEGEGPGTALRHDRRQDRDAVPPRALMRAEEIDTPALLVDLDVMERNLRRVADYTRATDCGCARTPRRTNRRASGGVNWTWAPRA